MSRLPAPLIIGFALGTGGAATAGEHDPFSDNGIGNNGWLEDPDDADNGIGNDGWSPNEGGGPCGTGGWGSIGTPEDGWIHVDAFAGNDSSADGTVDHPYLTASAALEAAKLLPAGADRVLAFWPGEYDASLALLPGDGWDDPVGLLGCSPTESVLIAANPDAPILDAAVAQSVFVRGLGFVGGTVAVTARDGAWLQTDTVAVAASRDVAIGAFGHDTVLEATHTVVDAPAADGCGWGVASWGANTTLVESAVSGSRGVAVFADGGSLRVDGGYFVSTVPDLGARYGRAIHTQFANVAVHNTYISDATDASIFVLEPLGGAIRGVIIDITGAGVIGQETTGDAIVVVGGSGSRVQVKNNWVYDSARSSLLIEEANVEISGNAFSGAGIEPVLGAGSLGQGRVQILGADAAQVLWLDAASEVAIDRDPLVCIE